ncbi:VVA0879 family protein [Pelotomaculum propionicicum]|uniref:Uncharacterized protein n=1 Tax=Pelotomaculum propionicicum TaxID=258475 RepID=A0A4Y7RXD6_9FIRM|nr:VVA0879 family protein [Pelotomaculum propionicicum]NLI12491.1 hypothetical protein [Peptococcaceae bacterium]TEB13406.1 hypothetical protein Pmgp_00300 [Pelotomaculum propionicicum]
MIKQSLEDWLKEAEDKFVSPGDDRGAIAFQCPRCKRIQTLKDFKDRGLDHNLAYQECLGRHDKSIGCDWAADGLLRTLGLGRIVFHDGGEMEVFDFAPVKEKVVANIAD